MEVFSTAALLGHFRVHLRFCIKVSLLKKCGPFFMKMTDLHKNETVCTTRFRMKVSHLDSF